MIDGKNLKSLQVYEVNSSPMKAGPFPGDFNTATFIAFHYESRDVLCLERLEIVPNAWNLNENRQLIQKYLSWSWDVSQGRQPWRSRTGNKLTYWSTMCRQKSSRADKPLLGCSKQLL